MKHHIYIISLFLSLIATSVSCDYNPEEILSPTRLDLKVDMSLLKGTQAAVTIVPEDDRVYYLADIMSAEEHDAILKKYNGSVEDAVNQIMKDMYEEYVRLRDLLYKDHAYKASFKSVNLIYGKFNYFKAGLTPETDYYAFAYCVDCVNDSTFRLAGETYNVKFRTTEVQHTPSKMKLEYMVRDYDGKLFCYTKPTFFDYDTQHNGKICRDPYFVDMIPKEQLDERYGGNIFAFVEEYYKVALETGMMSRFLHSDICRKEYYMRDYSEGDTFYVIGAPYNTNNLKKAVYT